MSITTDIEELTDEEALEAVNLLAGELFGATPDDEVLAEVSESSGIDGQEIRDAIGRATPHDVAELARLTLIAASEESADEVRAAIDSVGEKAFIIEAIVVGTLALGAINLLVTRGKAKQTFTRTTTRKSDGTETVKEEQTVEYTKVGDVIGPVLRRVLAAAAGAANSGGR